MHAIVVGVLLDVAAIALLFALSYAQSDRCPRWLGRIFCACGEHACDLSRGPPLHWGEYTCIRCGRRFSL